MSRILILYHISYFYDLSRLGAVLSFDQINPFMSSEAEESFISILPFLPDPNSKRFRLKKTNQSKSELTSIAQQHLYEDVLKSKAQNRQPNLVGRPMDYNMKAIAAHYQISTRTLKRIVKMRTLGDDRKERPGRKKTLLRGIQFLTI